MTQSVLEALLVQFEKWPEDELIGFGVDPDGEVRGHSDIYNDFYPEVPVHSHYKVEGTYVGDYDSRVIVTREMFEDAR